MNKDIDFRYLNLVEQLFKVTPSFQNIGAEAYKPGLDRTIALQKACHVDLSKIPTIHVAGTNGKGSVSAITASWLQETGQTVGLFSSPHLIDFTERIRVNGIQMSHSFFVDFMDLYAEDIKRLSPSFFEVTTVMALRYFQDKKVDIAVIEVGLGGRLDSTNIINPIASVITNIAYDHTDLLGDTLAKIAEEKAGIIKRHTPVIIGESTSETLPVFQSHSKRMEARMILSEERYNHWTANYDASDLCLTFETASKRYEKTIFTSHFGDFSMVSNVRTALTLFDEIGEQFDATIADFVKGLSNTPKNTGFRGRWEQILTSPRVIIDTAHNANGIEKVVAMANEVCSSGGHIHFFLGMAKDKDVKSVLKELPNNFSYHFSAPSNERGLNAKELQQMASENELEGDVVNDIHQWIELHCSELSSDDVILITGSNFLVADFLK